MITAATTLGWMLLLTVLVPSAMLSFPAASAQEQTTNTVMNGNTTFSGMMGMENHTTMPIMISEQPLAQGHYNTTAQTIRCRYPLREPHQSRFQIQLKQSMPLLQAMSLSISLLVEAF